MSNVLRRFLFSINGGAGLKVSLGTLFQPVPRVCPDACEDYSIGFGDFHNNRIGVLFGRKYTRCDIYLVIDFI